MADELTGAEEKFISLSSLIPENERFYLWGYSFDRGWIGTSCPEGAVESLEYLFELFDGVGKLKEAVEREDYRPLIIGSPIGMQWAGVFNRARGNDTVIRAGPIFYKKPDEKAVYSAIYDMPGKTKKGRQITAFMNVVGNLPVISYAIFSRYTAMLHNTLNEEQVLPSDIQATMRIKPTEEINPAGMRNRVDVYYAERALLSMVRNGDLNYQEALQNSSALSGGVNVSGSDPLRQAKTSIIVFTSLVVRAAIEGGLSPEIAYPLGDQYIQHVENCRDSGELTALSTTMYHDFILRVHQVRSNPNVSHAVQKCCDYIERNLGRKIKAADLAQLVGYTEYYLTEKFRKETGMPLNTYIRFARIERAKVLLETTDIPVNEIADQLAFNTPNYFIQSFRQTTGQTPAAYRRGKRSEN